LTVAGSAQSERWRAWHVPLSVEDMTLREAHADLATFGMRQRDVPLLIQLVENPRFDVPGIEIFCGATNLLLHDYIHIVLGRGLLPKDEAFVIGFTMGSTNRVGDIEEKLYALIARYLYPAGYRFDDEDEQVYRDALRLGYVSDCRSLAEVDFAPMLDHSLAAIRSRIGLEPDLLRAYYGIEKRRYPRSTESARLLP
jgi:hypothetical protein